MNITKFDSTQFFRDFATHSDKGSRWNGAHGIWEIEFMRESNSVSLLESYYQAKYGTIVTIQSMNDAETRNADVLDYIKAARVRAEGQEEHREVLLVKYKGSQSFANGHAIPVIYIKAQGKEALLLANALGARFNDHNWVLKNPGMPVYVIEEKREMSNTGCYIDAFVVIREAIGKDRDVYRTPNLLQHLEAHSKESTRDSRYMAITSIHPRLLKTFQASTLVTQYSDNAEKDVITSKKGQTISQHIAHYKRDVNGAHIHSYVAQKGMKYRGTVEMEFYMQQLRSQDCTELSALQRGEFIAGAKKLLNPKRAPSDASVTQLHQYTLDFASQHQCVIVVKPTAPTVQPSRLRYQVGSVLACAAAGALSAYVLNVSPDISLLNKMASIATQSDATAAIIKNTVIGAVVGAILIVGYEYAYGSGQSRG